MIKATELRIGNLVEYTGKGSAYYPAGIVTVSEVLQDGINLTHGDHTAYEDNLLQGIPLTEEWINKMGIMFTGHFFEGVQNGNCISLADDLSKLMIGVQAAVIDRDFDSVTTKSIRYVHQLQNLYYSLTGEELTIKEPI